MGHISLPDPVKLIVGMLSGRRELLDQAVERLGAEFGPIDLTGDIIDFDFTHYYDQQMGGPLLRQFVAFERLITPDEIAAVKLATNRLEAEFAAAARAGPQRPVNLDPGYVAEGKLVLASVKDHAHRIYLGDGVYAEVTLRHTAGRWTASQHTFPDYASGAYDAFLTDARRRLRVALGRKERQA